MTNVGNEGNAALPEVAPDQVEAFFHSEAVAALKLEICDIGRRLWQREYVDGNGGNVSVRVARDLVLCTPTLVSKGFMQPEDLCLVDLAGEMKAGSKRRTSELLMHLAIYREQPLAKACVHCHPPTATGFAICGLQPPSGMIPEMEIMCGVAAVAPYLTPGTQAMGDAVAALAGAHNTILMANHGAVAWGYGVEDAYFKMEILEAYCRSVLAALQLERLGHAPKVIPAGGLADLLRIKRSLGIPDPRA
jgi:L-fuculose-phosphate aldolase